MRFAFYSRARGGPGEIRGRQMAERLGGTFNPTDGTPDDISIYILGTTPTVDIGSAVYHDILDCGTGRIRRAMRMRGDIITSSMSQHDALVGTTGNKQLWLIPQHHCNFHNELRTRQEVSIVGCIGGDSAVQWPHYAVNRMLNERGLQWHFEHRYSRRTQVVAFYRSIDIQISWRPTHARGIMHHMNVLKLCNAGSFGIPTVAYPEPAYHKEWRDECLFAETIYGLMDTAKKLAADRTFYEDMAGKALEKARSYHIDRICELYRSLPTQN